MKIRRVIAGLVTLLFVLTAFASLPAVPAKAQAEEGNTLFLAMQQDMPDLNTWNLASNSVWKADVIGFGFEGLVGLDYNLQPYGLLAENWEFYLGNLTYIFNLRHNVQFNDGSSGVMDADDVVFMYKAAREGTTLSANIINAFDGDNDGRVSQAEIDAGVIKVNDYRVKMVLPKPYGQFLTTTAGLYIQPASIWINHLTGGVDPDHGGLLDVLWNDQKATVATGPFKYGGGIPSTYRVMDKWTGYWGKNFTTLLGYKLYPPFIDHLYFKIYASLDTAILALQSGAVDYIDWAVTAGRVPGLQADPNIGLSYLQDNGYFYLAFNQKVDPCGNTSFRRAISHLINKDQIVNVYLGGYGSKGSAVEPPFWGPEWYNNSVATYPFDITEATRLLNEAGFLDVNGDGLRELPSGLPMQKITILTPPADYDPVRIRAGELIALNMRSVGINAEAKAIDFDTLVAKLQSMDFTMLIIGWSLSSEPVGNVFDIIGPRASQNTFGWWSLANPNPFYSGLGGVVTRADATSQALADHVLELEAKAKQEFDVLKQQTATKWAEGEVAKAVPVNVLYYRVNVEAYRNAWVGWIPFLGTMLQSGVNLYCLSNLRPAGAGGVIGATASVNAGLDLPGKVLLTKSVPATVVAIDNLGNPVSGAAVAVQAVGVKGAATVTLSAASGLTGADGTFKFNVTGSIDGYSYVNVTVTKGGVESKASTIVRSTTNLPKIAALTVTPERLVLRPNQQSNLSLTVTDENGAPVADAAVAVDPNLVGFGHVDHNSVLTDADGVATMIYYAPNSTEFAKVSLNTHLTLTLSLNVTKAGYSWKGTASVFPVIYNWDSARPSIWNLVRIIDLSSPPALNATTNSTIIQVEALDEAGNPLADHKLNVSYSDESNLVKLDGDVMPIREVTTDLVGRANIPVQVKSGAASSAFKVVIQNVTAINSGPATVTMTYLGATPPAKKTFAGYIEFSRGGAPVPQFMVGMGDINATAHVWNNTGELTNSVEAGIVVSATKAGDLAWSDLIQYSSNFDGWGLVVTSFDDKGGYVTGGPFNTKFNATNWYENGPPPPSGAASENSPYNIGFDWGMMYGTNITDGLLEIPIYGQDVAAADDFSSVFVVPDSIGFFNTTSYSYEIDGPTSIKGDYVIQRSEFITSTSMAMKNSAGALKPVVKVMNPGFDTTRVYGYAVDQNGDPVAGATVQCFQVFRYYGRATDFVIVPYGTTPFRPGTVTAGSSGSAYETLLSMANNMIGTSWKGFIVPAATLQANVNCKASLSGTYSTFATQSVIMAVGQALLKLDPITEAQRAGSMVNVKATVTDSKGAPVANIPVTLSVSGGALLVSPTLATDSNGVATFVVDTSQMQGVKAAFVKVDAKAGGPAYEIASAQLAIPVKNPGPQISVGSPAGAKVAPSDVMLIGSVYDPVGFLSIKVKVDNGQSSTVQQETSEATVALSRNLGNLTVGEHTVTINATDALGVFSEKTVTFTVTEEKVSTTSATTAWVVAAIGWILFVIVAVMMMMRMRKPKPAMMEPGAGETTEAPPAAGKL